jgi:hypothetical protein
MTSIFKGNISLETLIHPTHSLEVEDDYSSQEIVKRFITAARKMNKNILKCKTEVTAPDKRKLPAPAHIKPAYR